MRLSAAGKQSPPATAVKLLLALGLAHVLHRDNLLDHDYLQRLVLGYECWAKEVLPRYTPAAVEAITGVHATDIETLARTYGQAKAPFIRLGQGLSRHASGGAATRAIACLPGLVGAWQRPGGGGPAGHVRSLSI